MVITLSAKFISMSMSSITLAGGAVGTGLLFGSYNVAVSRNPEEGENLFNTSLMAFALIETFVFISLLISMGIYIL